ncbi:MAG: SDR family oxidoreductase [Chloroflexota bacterium]|nr:SDR family oxidoreductase [Chloroflexota bacterium]
MKIAVFGATGRAGQHLVEQALAAGQEVVALVRTPAKLNISDTRLSVIQGDVQDSAKVEQTIAGVDGVVSVLGPASNAPTFEISKGMQHILAAMSKHGVQRLVISAGAGVGDPNDAPKLIHKAINALLKLLSGNVYEDMKRTVATVRASDRDWVIVRVPRLTDDPKSGKLQVGYVGKGMGMQIGRADMTDFMLKQLASDTYLRKAPAISN